MMIHQQMPRDIFECDKELPDNTGLAINAIPDQSAKIVFAVLDNANLIPDDDHNETADVLPAYKTQPSKTSRMKKKKSLMMRKQALVCLQEEHALWLK